MSEGYKKTPYMTSSKMWYAWPTEENYLKGLAQIGLIPFQREDGKVKLLNKREAENEQRKIKDTK